MIPAPLRPFVSQLLRATDSGDIQWSEGGEQAYFAAQKEANIHIRYHFDLDAEVGGFHFKIVRGKRDAFFSVFDYEDDFPQMRNLYDAVSVNAAGGGKIVEGLFD